jgi:hypothetical protein
MICPAGPAGVLDFGIKLISRRKTVKAREIVIFNKAVKDTNNSSYKGYS